MCRLKKSTYSDQTEAWHVSFTRSTTLAQVLAEKGGGGGVGGERTCSEVAGWIQVSFRLPF